MSDGVCLVGTEIHPVMCLPPSPLSVCPSQYDFGEQDVPERDPDAVRTANEETKEIMAILTREMVSSLPSLSPL